jgi:hypothetical protein
VKKSFYSILIATFFVTACGAQTTNVLELPFTEWGESIHGVQLAIALTNNIIPAGSELVVFTRMKNSSTNVIYIGESSPESDFVVSVKSDSGKIYQLTQTHWVHSRFMLATLNPGASRDLVIHAGVDRYYEPPDIVSTKKNVPPGNYTLKATRTFSWTRNSVKLDSVESNLLKVQIN